MAARTERRLGDPPILNLEWGRAVVSWSQRAAVTGSSARGLQTGCSMESRAKFLGHPIHQMLIPFPLGAFALSIAMDAAHIRTGRREHERAAVNALDFGLVTAALAAPFGLVDWLQIEPNSRAKGIGAWHALGNAMVVGLFATSRLMRLCDRRSKSAKWVSGSAFLLSGATAWLGGELVVRHRIGVQDGLEQEPTSDA